MSKSLKQRIVETLQPLAERAFCPTGEGGGIDNSCSPKQEEGKSGAVASGFSRDKEGQRTGYASWTNADGRKVELRTSTIYGKTGNLRDIKKTKQIAVIDLDKKEHKAFSVKGEGHDKRAELMGKVNKVLSRDFGIRLSEAEML